jgi:MFS family permease
LRAHPVNGDFVIDVLPSMILLGLGAGTAFNPVLLAAMSDVEPTEAGLASGLVNTSFMMGGALGLAVLASLAASRTDALLADGESLAAALTGGYQVAFLVGAIFAAAAAGLGASLLRVPAQAAEELEEAAGEPAPCEPAPCSSFSIPDHRPSGQLA